MKKNIAYLIVLHIVLAVYSFLGIFSKLASGEVFLSERFLLYYGVVLAGLLIYAIVWQQLLKKLPLVTAYSNKAMTVIWGIIWGNLFFQEPVTAKKIIGALVIMTGVYMVVLADYNEIKDTPYEDKEND